MKFIMNPKISIILPIYKNDNPKWICQSIDSILNQTYTNSQLFIGVDGPISESISICLSLYEKNKSIIIIRFSENRGLACVLNDLLDLCFEDGYEYIARMDADDISMPDRLEKQMAFLLVYPEIDVVGGAISEIDENGVDRGKIIVYPENPQDCYNFFSKRNPLAHPAVLFRKRFFMKSRCKYRPEYPQNQDTMLWYDGLMRNVQMANIQDVVLRFRITDSLFNKRRNGLTFAKKQLNDRKMINKGLRYGIKATLFAYAMFLLLISPAWVKKISYKMFR